MRTRVLAWDPHQSGHHRAWLRMLLDTAPPNVEMLVPDWLDFAPAEAPTFHLVDADAFASVTHALRETAPDVLVLPDLRPLLPSAALWRSINVPAVVAIDHASEHLRLLEEPFRSRGLRRSASALRHLIWREALVRRQPVTILSTHPDSPKLGSRRLRSATRHMSMPIETLREVEVSRWPPSRRRVLLVGALQPRKGLEALVRALEALGADFDRDNVEVLVAGRPSSTYRVEVQRLMGRLVDGGFMARFVDRYLGDDEYSAVVATADVVVLPYDRFIGGSGIVGSLLGRQTSVVTSDYGWLGRFAAERGAYTFPNGDIEALGRAIGDALTGGRALSHGGSAFLPKEEAMRALWEVVVD